MVGVGLLLCDWACLSGSDLSLSLQLPSALPITLGTRNLGGGLH